MFHSVSRPLIAPILGKYLPMASLSTNSAQIRRGNNKTESRPFRDPIRQVFISQSTDVFSNLALEDWLYRHHDFDHKVIFLYKQFISSPAWRRG